MYVDLSVNAKFNGQRDQVNFMNRVIELGYGAIAWNRTVTGNLNGNKLVPVTPIAINPKMINNNTNRVLSGVNTGIQCNSCQLHVPEPIVSPLTSNNIVQPTSSTAEIKQYVRLTYIVDEISEAQCLTSSNACLQQYDIVAAVPGNNKVLSYLCKTADIDIISFNFTQRLPMSLDKKMVSFSWYAYCFCSKTVVFICVYILTLFYSLMKLFGEEFILRSHMLQLLQVLQTIGKKS